MKTKVWTPIPGIQQLTLRGRMILKDMGRKVMISDDATFDKERTDINKV